VEAYRAWTWRLSWRMPVPCWSHTRFGGDCEADYPGVGWDGPRQGARPDRSSAPLHAGHNGVMVVELASAHYSHAQQDQADGRSTVPPCGRVRSSRESKLDRLLAQNHRLTARCTPAKRVAGPATPPVCLALRLATCVGRFSIDCVDAVRREGRGSKGPACSPAVSNHHCQVILPCPTRRCSRRYLGPGPRPEGRCLSRSCRRFPPRCDRNPGWTVTVAACRGVAHSPKLARPQS
jgi:hypothetical protein